MFTRDDAKHPCTRLTCIRGFAVGHIEPYPRTWPTENPYAQIFYKHGLVDTPMINRRCNSRRLN